MNNDTMNNDTMNNDTMNNDTMNNDTMNNDTMTTENKTRWIYEWFDYTEEQRAAMKAAHIEEASRWEPPMQFSKMVYIGPDDPRYGTADMIAITHSHNYPLIAGIQFEECS